MIDSAPKQPCAESDSLVNYIYGRFRNKGVRFIDSSIKRCEGELVKIIKKAMQK